MHYFETWRWGAAHPPFISIYIENPTGNLAITSVEHQLQIFFGFHRVSECLSCCLGNKVSINTIVFCLECVLRAMNTFLDYKLCKL